MDTEAKAVYCLKVYNAAINIKKAFSANLNSTPKNPVHFPEANFKQLSCLSRG